MNKGKDLPIESKCPTRIIEWVPLMMLPEAQIKKMVVSEDDQELLGKTT